MKKIILIVILIITYITNIYGQVETVFFPNKDAFKQNSLLKEYKGSAKIKVMPPLDMRIITLERQQEKEKHILIIKQR